MHAFTVFFRRRIKLSRLNEKRKQTLGSQSEVGEKEGKVPTPLVELPANRWVVAIMRRKRKKKGKRRKEQLILVGEKREGLIPKGRLSRKKSDRKRRKSGGLAKNLCFQANNMCRRRAAEKVRRTLYGGESNGGGKER